MLDTYKIVVIAFSVLDKVNKVGFFEKIFWWLMLVSK